jgi:hypothetical protein
MQGKWLWLKLCSRSNTFEQRLWLNLYGWHNKGPLNMVGPTEGQSAMTINFVRLVKQSAIECDLKNWVVGPILWASDGYYLCVVSPTKCHWIWLKLIRWPDRGPAMTIHFVCWPNKRLLIMIKIVWLVQQEKRFLRLSLSNQDTQWLDHTGSCWWWTRCYSISIRLK